MAPADAISTTDALIAVMSTDAQLLPNRVPSLLTTYVAHETIAVLGARGAWQGWRDGMPETETLESVETCDVCGTTTDTHSMDCVPCRSCSERVNYYDRCETCHHCESCCLCSYCESCDSRYRYSDSMCGECGYCESCCDCDQDSGLIHDYSYTPDEITFHSLGEDGQLRRQYSSSRAPDGATYLGLEIETEAVHGDPETIAEIWSEYSSFGYAKHDGSLSDGVECVTHPYTYAALRSAGLDRTLAQMAKAGARAWGTGTCGLHIHVSRRAFAHRSHMWRFARALDALQTELIKLAGRNSDEWATWRTDRPDTIRDVDYVTGRPIWRTYYGGRPPATKIVAGKAESGTRYRAINLENRHTIELRFWRGSLNPIHVLGAAAVTDALVEWTRQMPFRQVRQGLKWLDFMLWAQDHLPSQQYDDITALATRRGLGAFPIDTRTDNEESLACAS